MPSPHGPAAGGAASRPTGKAATGPQPSLAVGCRRGSPATWPLSGLCGRGSWLLSESGLRERRRSLASMTDVAVSSPSSQGHPSTFRSAEGSPWDQGARERRGECGSAAGLPEGRTVGGRPQAACPRHPRDTFPADFCPHLFTVRHLLLDSELREGRRPVHGPGCSGEFSEQTGRRQGSAARCRGLAQGAASRRAAEGTGPEGTSALPCFFTPREGPRLSPCEATEKCPSFCRRICSAFWVPDRTPGLCQVTLCVGGRLGGPGLTEGGGQFCRAQ